jgi:hypothetical protein
MSNVIQTMLEALKMLLSYTLACEGLLNAKPAGQIDIARAAIALGEAELRREPVAWLDTNRWDFVSGARSPIHQFPSGNWVPLYTREEIK